MTDLDNDFEGANPYNKNKAWQNDSQDGETQNADTLFVPKRTKPKTPATKVESTEDDNSGEDGKGNGGSHDFEKRWKDLKAHHDKTVRELREELGKNTSAVGSTIPTTPPKTKEELEQLRIKDPAAFEAMKSIAQLIVSEETSEVRSKLSEIEKRENDFAKQKALADIVGVHPDFEDLRNNDEFHLWAESQPKEIQDWIYNNPTDGRKAIRAIDLYKMDAVKSKPKESSSETSQGRARQDGADSLVSTKTSGANSPSQPKVWSRSEIKRLSMDEYEKHEKEIDLAVRQGRIIN